jgi:hypothetical protein
MVNDFWLLYDPSATYSSDSTVCRISIPARGSVSYLNRQIHAVLGIPTARGEGPRYGDSHFETFDVSPYRG